MIDSFEIEGLNELIKKCGEISEQALPYIEQASIKAGDIVLRKTKSYALKYHKTGNLQKSLKLGKPTKANKAKYNIFSKVYLGKGGAHGVPLELGHKIVVKRKVVGTVKEHPFMRPAADESKTEVVDIVVNAMNKALEEFGRD